MTGKTHLTLGILIGIVFSSFFANLSIYQYLLIILITAGSSLLPDVDTDSSFIQYKVRGWGRPALTQWFINYKNRKTLLGTLFYIVLSFIELIIRAILIAAFGIVAKLVVHRSVTHYLLSLLLIFILLVTISLYGKINIIYSVFFFIGYLSHILGDMLTRSGVKIFFPMSKRNFHLLPVKYRLRTGVVVSKEEYLIIGIGLLITTTLVIFNLARFKLI